MLRTTLIGGTFGAIIATLGVTGVAPAASAASVDFWLGPPQRHAMMHNGRNAYEVCRTKYQWVKRHRHDQVYRVRVVVGQQCHWEYPPPPPPRPGVSLHFHVN